MYIYSLFIVLTMLSYYVILVQKIGQCSINKLKYLKLGQLYMYEVNANSA